MVFHFAQAKQKWKFYKDQGRLTFFLPRHQTPPEGSLRYLLFAARACAPKCEPACRLCTNVSAASSPGRRLVRAMWLCRGLGQAWRLSAAKGVEKSKSKIKNGSSKNWSSKGKIYKDPCLSHNENHGFKTFYALLHLKWLWRQPSASDQRHLTWHHLRYRTTCYPCCC